MIDYTHLYQALNTPQWQAWSSILPGQINQAIHQSVHGDLDKWLDILKQLPSIHPSIIDLSARYISIGSNDDTDSHTLLQIEQLLTQLHPWRKGPYSLFDLIIDTEWRSDLKWDRLKTAISPLNDRIVLDVGCGSGYHCWRMAGENARLVVGIDPTLLYTMQFFAIKHFIKNEAVHVLPLGIDDVPNKLETFDSVFSMGILYHRRSPIDHLYQLKDCLRSGGELILETLVIDGELGATLLPEQRYAKMRNVWFIPSCPTLQSWLQRCGFRDINLIDVNQTTSDEQRTTKWMQFDSLNTFLDPNNINLTLEGYPAPKRAIFVATKP